MEPRDSHLFTIMAINPRLCAWYWFMLPWYSTCVSVSFVVFLLGVLAPYYDASARYPSGCSGSTLRKFESVRTTPWLAVYVCNLVLTCLASLQVHGPGVCAWGGKGGGGGGAMGRQVPSRPGRSVLLHCSHAHAICPPLLPPLCFPAVDVVAHPFAPHTFPLGLPPSRCLSPDGGVSL